MPKRNTTAPLTAPQLEWLTAEAGRTGLGRSELIRRIIDEHIERSRNRVTIGPFKEDTSGSYTTRSDVGEGDGSGKIDVVLCDVGTSAGEGET